MHHLSHRRSRLATFQAGFVEKASVVKPTLFASEPTCSEVVSRLFTDKCAIMAMPLLDFTLSVGLWFVIRLHQAQ